MEMETGMAGVKQILKRKEGASMVSVIAAFTLLMIAVAMLSAAVAAARNMIVRAEEYDRKYAGALKELYGEYDSAGAPSGSTLHLIDDEGTSISMQGALKEMTTEDGQIHFYYYQYPEDSSGENGKS